MRVYIYKFMWQKNAFYEGRDNQEASMVQNLKVCKEVLSLRYVMWRIRELAIRSLREIVCLTNVERLGKIRHEENANLDQSWS